MLVDTCSLDARRQGDGHEMRYPGRVRQLRTDSSADVDSLGALRAPQYGLRLRPPLVSGLLSLSLYCRIVQYTNAFFYCFSHDLMQKQS